MRVPKKRLPSRVVGDEPGQARLSPSKRALFEAYVAAARRHAIPQDSRDQRLHERIVGRNPIPADDRRSETWSDISKALAEDLVQARADVLRKMCDAPAADHPGLSIGLCARYFDVYAALFLRPVNSSAHTGHYDDRLRVTKECLLDWGQREFSCPNSIQYQFETDLRLRLAERHAHWQAVGLRKVRDAETSSVEQDAPTSTSASAPSPPEEVPKREMTLADLRRAKIDAFIKSVQPHTSRKVTRTAIWRTAGYHDKTEFLRYQRGEGTEGAARKIERVLRMSPPEFIDCVSKLTKKEK